jgi:solute:Na+ symporter, SSS family
VVRYSGVMDPLMEIAMFGIPSTWLWAAVFLVSIAAVAVLKGRGASSAEAFEMGAARLGFWPIFGSVVATNVGAAVLVGAVGYGFQSGLNFAIVIVPQTLFVVLLLWFWAPRIHQLRLHSVPDLLARRFGAQAALLPTLVVALVLMASLSAMQIIGMGALLSTLFAVDPTTGMIVACMLAVVFTMWSGLPGVAWTDTLQAVWIAFGVVLLIVAALMTDAPVEPAEAVAATSVAPEITEVINLLVLFGPFYLVWQTTWQRIAAAPDIGTARRAVGWGWGATFVVFIGALGLGMVATGLLPQTVPPDQVLGALITLTLDPAVAGLLWAALFAAMFTGATSFLLSGAVNLVNDVLPWMGGLARYRNSLIANRLAVAFLGLFSLILALNASQIITLYFRIISLTTVVLLWPVVAAMSRRPWPSFSILASQIAGLGVALAWVVAGNPFALNEIIPGLAAGGIAFLLAAQAKIRRGPNV